MPIPAAAATTAATTPTPALPSGASRYENSPTAPNATKPTTPTSGRRTEARPRTAPRSSETTTMPVIRATLSFVPNRAIARSFSEAAKRSMNCVPTAVISDGCEPPIPHTSSPAASATPAATTPGESAVDRTDGRRRRVVRGALGACRQLGRDSHASTVRLVRHTVSATRLPRANVTHRNVSATGPRSRRTGGGRGRTVATVTATIDARTGAAPTVLVVDDEPIVREVVARYLQRDGFVVHEAGDGAAAVEWLAAAPPGPGRARHHAAGHRRADDPAPAPRRRRRAGDPADGARRRGRPRRRPRARRRRLRGQAVLAPGARRARCATCCGGPTRPPSPRRRTGSSSTAACASTRLPGRSTSTGGLVTLTPKEFDLLVTLARSPRRVFTRRQLLADVWDSAPEYQDPATVTVHVGRLRQKLEADPEEPRWITTARGVGYRFEP